MVVNKLEVGKKKPTGNAHVVSLADWMVQVWLNIPFGFPLDGLRVWSCTPEVWGFLKACKDKPWE